MYPNIKYSKNHVFSSNLRPMFKKLFCNRAIPEHIRVHRTERLKLIKLIPPFLFPYSPPRTLQPATYRGLYFLSTSQCPLPPSLPLPGFLCEMLCPTLFCPEWCAHAKIVTPDSLTVHLLLSITKFSFWFSGLLFLIKLHSHFSVKTFLPPSSAPSVSLLPWG